MHTALLALAMLGCAPEPGPVAARTPVGQPDGADDTGGGGEDDTPVPQLAAVPRLARLSLDLRGTRPSLDEIAAVQADPAVLDDYARAWVREDAFLERVGWIWNDSVHTAVWGSTYERFGELSFDEWRAMGQEPLRIIRAVVAEDRPFSDVVTSPQLQVHPTTAQLWSDPAPTGAGWQWGAPGDDRPVAGMLSTNALWLRYTADALNYNRQRANAVARIFLCADFLDREGGFTFEIDADDLTAVEQAVRTEPACVTCHAALDPLAGFFGGFAQRSDPFPLPVYARYSTFMADHFASTVPPAYYGQPGRDLVDLGAFIAADPRFAACAAERFHTGLVGTPPATLPEREAWADAFEESGLDARDLAVRIVASDAYGADEARMLTPEQLHSAFADLLWWNPGGDETDGLNPLSWSVEHRLLAGGTDDVDVLERNRSLALGPQVVLAHVARRAAPKAVAADLARPLAERRIVPVDATASEDEVRVALAQVRTRFLSRPVEADDPAVDRLLALWQASGGAGDPEAAWGVVVEALLRHPAQAVY